MSLDSPALLEHMLRHSGAERVVYAGHTTWGHLDFPDEELYQERFGVMAQDPFVTIAAGVLDPAPVQGGELRVDDTVYEIRRVQAIEDGRLLRLWLGEP